MITEGSVLNTRYRLDKKIGQGGFAQVFLTTDQLLKRQVAAKVLNSELTEDATFLGRFEREAQSIANLDHPNILGVYDYGHTDETAFLIMPYVEGGTLHDKLRREKKLSLQQAASYLQQAAAALDYAHRRQIVHRDIKPQNMLLRAEDDRLLLGDFGIAKVLSAASAQSRTGVMGTLSYMSPEQLEGSVSFATDIYALGCVLFQVLTGELPFMGETQQVMMGHILKPVPSIVERSRGQLPPSLQTIIDKALAKRPEDRFQTAGEMSRAFHELMAGGTYNPSAPTLAVNNYNLTTSHTEIAPNPNFIPPPPTGNYTGAPTAGNYDRTQVAGINTGQVASQAGMTGGYPPPAHLTGPYVTGPQAGPHLTGPPGYPPGFTPPQGMTPSGGYPPPPPKKSNFALIGGLAGILVLVAIALALILALGGKKDNPTPTAVANLTTAPATTASGTVTTAPNTTPPATTVAADPIATALKEANDTFYVKGDLTAGLSKFRSLSTTNPNNAKVWRDYGIALYLFDQDAGGIEPLEKAAQLDPKDALTYLYLTDVYGSNRRYADSAKAAQTAAQLDPNGWIGQTALSSANTYTFKLDQAKPQVDAMQKVNVPADLQPYFNWIMAVDLFYQDDFAGSAAAMDKTLAAWPNLPSAIAVRGSIYLFSPADKADAKANQEKAKGLLEKALKLSPQSSTITAALADYYLQTEDYANAEKFAQDALKKNSTNPSAIYIIGKTLLNKNDYTNAFKQFDRCIQLDEYHLSCYFDWALGLIDQGYDLNKNNKKAEAQAAWKAGQDKALQAYKFLPKNPGYNWLVGYSYYTLADYKNATLYFQKAVQAAPNEASYYGWLGVAYLADNQRDKAQEAYNKGLAIDPENASIKDLGSRLSK